MLTVRLACNQFRILIFEEILQSRLWQQRHTNLYNHTFIYPKQAKKQSAGIIQNKLSQKYLHRSLFTFLEINPAVQFTINIFSFDSVNFTV